MIRALTSGVSGIQQFQNKLSVIGNNIANSNTIAFKGARADFEDSFSETLGDSMQLGSGVSTSSVKNSFTQGTISPTGKPTDLAIAGDGFFVVRDPNSGEQFVTRAGDFKMDTQGYLITNGGYRLQGFNNPALSSRGDIQVDSQFKPETAAAAAKVAAYKFADDGQVKVTLSDGTQYVRGQILLQTFSNPNALMKEGNNLYSNLVDAGPIGGSSPEARAPRSNGLGSIQAEALEGSNVDLTTEFASLITTQRGFQANARIITTTDEMLQEIVNLKR
jgi:flagellar hook protein FlgE